MYAYKWRCACVCVHVTCTWICALFFVQVNYCIYKNSVWVFFCVYICEYMSISMYICVGARMKCVSVFVCMCFLWTFKDSTFNWLFISSYFKYIVRDSVSNKAWEPVSNSQHPWKKSGITAWSCNFSPRTVKDRKLPGHSCLASLTKLVSSLLSKKLFS